MEQNKNKGIICILLSSLFFALVGAFVSLAGPLPFFQKALFRNMVSLVIAVGVLIAVRTPIRVPGSCILPMTGRIVFGIGSVFCNYYAIDHLVLASANSLNKLGPFFAILFSAWFLKEKTSKPQLLCIGVALIGGAFLIFPNLHTIGLPAAIALIGGICSGGAHASLRAVGRKNEINDNVVVFWFSLISSLVTLIPSLLFWNPMTVRQIIIMLLAGTSCAAAQFALTAAYRYASPRDISIFDCSQIVIAGVLGYLVFRQVPTVTDLIAYGFIILASMLLFVCYHREKMYKTLQN